MRFEEITCLDALHSDNPCYLYPYSYAPWVTGGRPIIGTDGDTGAVVSSRTFGGASPTGQTFNGVNSENLYVSLRRVNTSPRYVISIYNQRGAQIGSTKVGTGSLANLATALNTDITLGTIVRMKVVNDTNQAYDPDNNFSPSRGFRWGR
jgi:hypothetical protein